MFNVAVVASSIVSDPVGSTITELVEESTFFTVYLLPFVSFAAGNVIVTLPLVAFTGMNESERLTV